MAFEIAEPLPSADITRVLLDSAVTTSELSIVVAKFVIYSFVIF